MSVIEVKPRSVQFKVIIFYFMLIIDVIVNSFIEPTFASKLGSKENLVIFYSIIVLQFVATILLIIAFFTIMWSTFLIRYGIVNYILRHFTVTLLIIPIYLLIYAAEKVSHIVINSLIMYKNNTFSLILCNNQIEYESQNQTITGSLFQKQDFQSYYYIQHSFKIIFYCTLINDVTRLISPKYYKKDFWIK